MSATNKKDLALILLVWNRITAAARQPSTVVAAANRGCSKTARQPMRYHHTHSTCSTLMAEACRD